MRNHPISVVFAVLATFAVVGAAQGQNSPPASPGVPDEALELICRGGPLLRWSEYKEVTASNRQMMSLIFQPASAAPDSKGENLKPSECAIRGHSGYFPPNVGFATGNAAAVSLYALGPVPTAAVMQDYLADSAHYWYFAVMPKHGYYEAIIHRAFAGPAPQSPLQVKTGSGSVEIRLDRTDGAFMSVELRPRMENVTWKGKPTAGPPVGGKAFRVPRAGEGFYLFSSRSHGVDLVPGHVYYYEVRLKDAGETQTLGEYRGEFTPATSAAASGGSIQGAKPQANDRLVKFRGKQNSAVDPDRQIVGELQKSTGPVRTVSVARAVPVVLPEATTPLVDAPGMFTETSAPIQGVAVGASRAAALKMDCSSNAPRISNIQGRITSSQRFTINGSCFGTPGFVEVIGNFSNGNLRLSFFQWTESAIVAEMPALPEVAGHTISVSVRRGGDGKQSIAKQAQYTPALRVVEIPSTAWSPKGAFVTDEVVDESGLQVGTFERPSVELKSQTTSFRLQVNSACALETLDVPATVGRVNSINGWDRGPAHQADVEIVWTPACKILSRNYGVAAKHQLHCSAAFELKARAACPVGIAPL